MKKTLMFVLLVVPTFLQASSEKFVNADGSKESSICIDAARTNMNLHALTNKYQISKAKLKGVSCNGMVLKDFVAKHSAKVNAGETVKVFSFDNEPGNIETEFCIAAAHSKEQFNEVMAKHGKTKHFAQSINCNNLPIEKFAKKYGNKSFSI